MRLHLKEDQSLSWRSPKVPPLCSGHALSAARKQILAGLLVQPCSMSLFLLELQTPSMAGSSKGSLRAPRLRATGYFWWGCPVKMPEKLRQESELIFFLPPKFHYTHSRHQGTENKWQWQLLLLQQIHSNSLNSNKVHTKRPIFNDWYDNDSCLCLSGLDLLLINTCLINQEPHQPNNNCEQIKESLAAILPIYY